jgi:predicted transcriptional regulator
MMPPADRDFPVDPSPITTAAERFLAAFRAYKSGQDSEAAPRLRLALHVSLHLLLAELEPLNRALLKALACDPSPAADVPLLVSAGGDEQAEPLTDTDKAILQVVKPDAPLLGEEIASRAGYRYNHVRKRLSILLKRGLLRKPNNPQRGYLKPM